MDNFILQILHNTFQFQTTYVIIAFGHVMSCHNGIVEIRSSIISFHYIYFPFLPVFYSEKFIRYCTLLGTQRHIWLAEKSLPSVFNDIFQEKENPFLLFLSWRGLSLHFFSIISPMLYNDTVHHVWLQQAQVKVKDKVPKFAAFQ